MVVFLLLTILALIYELAIRPRLLEWGATSAEVAAHRPGDEHMVRPRVHSTRAMTLKARPEEIWPWLIQIGQDRGGFYSYDWLENLLGLNIHSAKAINPDWQQLQVGDPIRLAPGEQGPQFVVDQVEPEKALVLWAGTNMGNHCPFGPGEALPDAYNLSTWAFYLDPIDEQHTRFTARFRSDWSANALITFGNHLLLEPAHFIMERGMLRGLKRRAERSSPSLRESQAGKQVAGLTT